MNLRIKSNIFRIIFLAVVSLMGCCGFQLFSKDKEQTHPLIQHYLDLRRLCMTGYSAAPDSAMIYTVKAMEAADSINGFGSREYVGIMSDYMIPDCMDFPELLEGIYNIVTTRFNPDSAYVYDAFYELGRVMSINKEYEKADNLFKMAAVRMESVEDSLMIEYQRALNWYNKSGLDLSFMMLPIIEKADRARHPYNNILKFKCYHQLAKNYSPYYQADYPATPMGFYELAEQYFDDVDEIDKTQLLYDKYRYLLNIDHREAIKCIDRLIYTLDEKNNPELLDWHIMAYIIRGDYCHNELLDDIQALQFYTKGNSLISAPIHDGLRIKRTILKRLYAILLPAGLMEEACHVAEVLVSLSDKYGTVEEYNENFINLADCYLRTGKFVEAGAAIKSIEDNISEEDPLLGDFYKVRGNYYFETGDYPKAYEDYMKADGLPQTNSEDILLVEALLKASSHVDPAQTVLIADSLNTKIFNTITHKILNISPNFRKQWHLVCNEVLANEIYAAQNGVDLSSELLDLSLFRKGLLLRTQNEIKKVLDSSLELRKKSHKLNELKRELTTVESSGNIEGYFRLQDKIEEIEWNLTYDAVNNSPNIKEELFITGSEIQKSIGNKDIAIEFIVTEGDNASEDYYAAIIFSKRESPKFIDLDSAKDSIEYNNVWGKIEPFLKYAENVYFSPDGILNGIAIEFLMDEKGEMAIEKFNLHRVMHLGNISREEEVKNKLVAFGVSDYNSPIGEAETIERGTMTDLPSVTLEMKVIQEKYNKSQSDIYFNDEATEATFKGLDGHPIGILHFSTHGIYRDYESLEASLTYPDSYDNKVAKRFLNVNQESLSALVLRQGILNWREDKVNTGEDDILTAKEIENMNFPNLQLTVLSACNSGLGEINGEGIQGLQRAFKIAGSKNIICSLNKVDDYWSAQFMGELYENLAKGHSIYDSFRFAQKNIREATPDNPVAWSSYILIE